MAYTYSQWVTSLANLLAITSTDPNFQTALPNVIDDAEQRIYRELDLLTTTQRDTSAAVSPGDRNFTLPSALGTFVVVQAINIVTPAGFAPQQGTLNPCIPTSLEMLDSLWPNVTGSGVPQYFAMVRQTNISFGPWPDKAYVAQVVGTVRPAPLSSSNVTTLLTQNFPDIFMAASLVFASGYMKNFGAMQGDPQSGQSWESHYQALMESAQTEEQRKKFDMAGWSSKQPAQQATPPRT